MATLDVVRISEIRKHIADVIEQVHLGVDDARKQGRQAELPKELAFEMKVIVEWQALEVTNSESGTTKETGVTTETGSTKETNTTNDSGTTNEKQGGYQTETSKGTTSESQSGSDTKTSNETSTHTQNTDQVSDTYES